MCTYLVGKDYLGFTVDWLFVHSHFWDIVHHHFIPLVHLLWLNLCLGSNWIVQTDIKNDCNLLSWYPYVSCFEMSLYWLKQGAVFYSYISSTKIIKDLGLVVTIYKIKYITKLSITIHWILPILLFFMNFHIWISSVSVETQI